MTSQGLPLDKVPGNAPALLVDTLLRNLEVEQALLGSLMANADCIALVCSIVHPGHFSEPLHSRIFAAILEIKDAGSTASPLTLRSRFEQDETMRELGGPKAFLARLLANASPLSAKDHAHIVRDLWNRRQIIAENDKLTGDILNTRGQADLASAIADHASRISELFSGQHKPVMATPFQWTNLKSIPPRRWLYGRHLVRGVVSVTVAPGGVGKSSLVMVEALAMVTGIPLLGKWRTGPLRVWLWNLEDPKDEIQRRVAAACMHYGIKEKDLNDGLYMDSGLDQNLCIAEQARDGLIIRRPIVDNVIEQINANKIDVLIIDPFVSSHAVSENDNTLINAVMKEWKRIADQTGCAVEIVHHTRKSVGDAVLTAESSRGAKAVTDAARDVRVINRMTESEGGRAGVDDHRLYFRAMSDKHNLAPPSDNSEWYRMENVRLPNGDDVGVPVQWTWPDPLEDLTVEDLRKAQQAIADGSYRADPQARQWAGHAIGHALGIETGKGLLKKDMTPAQKAGRAKIRGAMQLWLKNNALVQVDRNDEKRKHRKFIEIGEHADD